MTSINSQPRSETVNESPLRPLRFLTVANVPRDPDSGAAGTVYYTNVALRELGHDVTEIWAEQLAPRRIAHGNLYSLLEQPRRYVQAIRRAFDKNSYDVVLSQQPQSYLAAREHRLQRRAGLFLTVSQGVENRIAPELNKWRRQQGAAGSRFPHRWLTPIMQALLRTQWPRAARWSDGIVVQHSQDRDFVCRSYGLPSSRVHVWASGLPECFLDTPARPMDVERLNRLLFVGQSAFYKGTHFLAEIVNEVLTRHPQVTMTWVCSENDHDAARNMFAASVRNRITMQPWRRQEELLQTFDTHGIFVFPTIAEGFAKAPLEAMSRGMCVVASDCCGMHDYIQHNESGHLVDIGDTQQFIRHIDDLLAAPKTAESISENARVASATFTWRDSAKRLLEFISKLHHNTDNGTDPK